MTTNKIQRAIDLALAGKLALERAPDFCLRVHRQLIEAANGWGGGAYYDHMHIWDHLTPTNRAQARGVPWARSMEQAYIDQGMTVPLAQARAGDVVFSRLPATVGHVGTLGTGADGRLWVLENATVRRGRSLGGALNWVPLSQWGGLTTVGRMPEAWVFDAAPAPIPVPVTQPPAPARQRVIVANGHGQFIDQTGRRVEVALPGGQSLIVNATDPDTVWVDVRGAK